VAPQLQAGVARAVTTPPVGITHAHWGAQTHTRAEGVDLDLWATALVLANGDTQVAIIDADVGGFSNDLTKRIKERITALTGILGDHIRLSASHTHSGGNLTPAWYSDGQEMIPGYVDSLVDRITGAVWQAQRALQPGRVAAGLGSAPVAMNRRLWHAEQQRIVLGRNREGVTDQALPVIRIDDEQERPIAVVVSYGCHPTIMAHRNALITPDFPGVLRRTVEANIDGLCLFLQGATGDQHSKESFSSRREGYHHVGRQLGLIAAGVAEGLETRPKVERLAEVLESGAELGLYDDQPGPEPDGTLRVATRRIELPLAELPTLQEAEAVYQQRAEALTAALKGGDPAEIQTCGYQAKRAQMRLSQARTYQGRTTASIDLQAMRIGPAALLAMPGEPFAAIGLGIRRQSPFPVTVVSGYSNGNFAYIPMREDVAVGGYGVWNSPLAAGAGEQVIEEGVALLRQLV
jgi:hypothetical protein